MSVSLNVAKAWAEAAFTAGHRMGVENPDLPEVSIEDYRPKRGKRSSKSAKAVNRELGSSEFNALCCDARVWNAGYGGQCSKTPLDGSPFCTLHKKQYEASLEKGGSDIRNGRYSAPLPESTLDGSNEKIPWKSLKGEKSSNASSKGEHPKPRGPPPKSENGGKKVWNAEIGQWEDPVVDGSETEDMSDAGSVGDPSVVAELVDETPVEEKDEEKVEETVLLIDEPAITPEEEQEIFGDDDEEVVASGIEIVKGVKPDGTEYEVEIHQFEPEPELEPESEPEPEPEPETESEPEAEPEAVVEMDEDVVTYSPPSPVKESASIPEVKDDQLIIDGVSYMFDADDGMVYHSESYDEVATYCAKTASVAWKSKKYEIQHMRDSKK